MFDNANHADKHHINHNFPSHNWKEIVTGKFNVCQFTYIFCVFQNCIVEAIKLGDTLSAESVVPSPWWNFDRDVFSIEWSVSRLHIIYYFGSIATKMLSPPFLSNTRLEQLESQRTETIYKHSYCQCFPEIIPSPQLPQPHCSPTRLLRLKADSFQQFYSF